MKYKMISIFLAAILCMFTVFGFTACTNKDTETVTTEEPVTEQSVEIETEEIETEEIETEEIETEEIESEEVETEEIETEEVESKEAETEEAVVEETETEEIETEEETTEEETSEEETSEEETSEEEASEEETTEEETTEEGDSEETEAGESEDSEGEAAPEPETDENGEFIFTDIEDADSEGGSATEEADGIPEAVQAFIIVRGFEWGPGVNKVVLELDESVDGIETQRLTRVTTLSRQRNIEEAFLSNRMGYEVEGSSRYITFVLKTTYEQSGSPFYFEIPGTQHNLWVDEYMVSISCTVEKDGELHKVRFDGDCIGNHFSPDVVAFNKQGTFSGEYFNVLKFANETLTINYALCEPTSIAGGEKNPLIIWLHTRCEGGDDMEIAILGYEVSALTEKEIQSHFISGEEVGAYVLVPQAPTYWRDAGDGVEHNGDMPSRYREILMDLITSCLEENDDIDPSRIYIMGASNGGFMTLEMIENYPDFFAAAVPVSSALAYSVYARNDDGSYKTIQGNFVETGDVYLTEEKLELLMQTPLWFIGAVTDNITPVLQYSVPTYHALIAAGAEDCWCTMYQNINGTESSNTRYLGHWAWVYLLNDQVGYVQDPEVVAESDEDTFFYGLAPSKNGGSLRVPDENGGYYENIYDWLNDQSRDKE